RRSARRGGSGRFFRGGLRRRGPKAAGNSRTLRKGWPQPHTGVGAGRVASSSPFVPLKSGNRSGGGLDILRTSDFLDRPGETIAPHRAGRQEELWDSFRTVPKAKPAPVELSRTSSANAGGAGGIRTHEWRFCRPLPWASWVPRHRVASVYRNRGKS